MQEGPGGAAERFDVRGAVGGEFVGRGGGGGGGGLGRARGTGGGVLFGHGEPGGDGGAGAAALRGCQFRGIARGCGKGEMVDLRFAIFS